MSNANTKLRLLELDAMRGVAALIVVIFHMFYRYNELYDHPNLTFDWADYGQTGVSLFFIVSGFVIFWTLQRIEKPLDFIVSRFSRLYPVYWAGIILTYLCVSYFGLPGREVSIGTAMVNFSMLQSFFYYDHVDSVYWTLTIELAFYFWMFAFYLSGQLHRSEYVLLAAMFISVLSSLEIIHLPYIFNRIFFLPYIPYFLAGICFFKINNNTARNRHYAIILLCAISAALILNKEPKFIPINIFYFLFFYLAIKGKLGFLISKPILFSSYISYSLYLIHQNIGYIIMNKLYSLNYSSAACIILAIVSCGAIATMLTYFVEQPALRAIRSFYKGNVNMQFLAKKLSFKKMVRHT